MSVLDLETAFRWRCDGAGPLAARAASVVVDRAAGHAFVADARPHQAPTVADHRGKRGLGGPARRGVV